VAAQHDDLKRSIEPYFEGEVVMVKIEESVDWRVSPKTMYQVRALVQPSDKRKKVVEVFGDATASREAAIESFVESMDYWPEAHGLEGNPIEGMPGGSVSGCIDKYEQEGDIDDPGAYCAAIADRVEPGWRKANPRGLKKRLLK